MSHPILPTLTKYNDAPGAPDQVYDAICKTLSDRQAQVNWQTFTRADWQLFAQMAEAEGVGPLLHRQAQMGVIKEEWPPEVQQFLQTAYYKTTAHNALLFHELERILAAFEAVQIPVIVLKGAALAQTIYPEPGLRPMGDLDLLVGFDQVSQAIKIFLEDGYKPLFVTSHHIGLAKPTHPNNLVELHFEIPLEKQNKTLISADWFWDQKTTLPAFNGQTYSAIFQPNPTAQLIYLIGHLWLQHSSNRRLIWLYDIYQIITQHKDAIAWELLGDETQKAQLCLEFDEAGKELYALFGLTIQSDFTIFNNSYSIPTNEIINLRQQPGLSSTFKVMRAFDRKTRFSLLIHFIFFDKSKIISQYKPQPERMWPLYLPRRWWEIGRSILQL